MSTIFHDEYFNYLCTYAGATSSLSEKTYFGLMKILYSRKFYWSIERDSNRNEDGLAFRKEWLKDHEECESMFGDWNNSSILEVLLKLANRCEVDIMGEPQNFDQTCKWFWMFLKNLGLDGYSDDENRTLSQEKVTEINEKLNIFLDRKYDKNGVGGLFPLRNIEGKDQREIEIWYQMNSYLMENFD